MNKKHINKFFKLFIIILFITFVIINKSYAISETINTYSPACILIDLDSSRILYSKDMYKRMYPASTTKVLTAILTVENCGLDELVTISQNAVSSIPYSYTTANLQVGEVLSVEQLLNVLLIHSANDAAVALAEHVSGSVDAFSELMNKKAIEIGCKDTHFINPNGIHDENHYSTAYDLSLIGKYAMNYDIIKEIALKTSYSLGTSNKYFETDRIFKNTNDLIHQNTSSYYPYVTGLKTGYTDPAQSCIIATASKDNVNLLCVVLHDERTEDGKSQRTIDCKTLFDYGFSNYSSTIVASKNSVALDVTVLNGTLKTRSLSLLYQTDIRATLPNDIDLSNIFPTSILKENKWAPIATGDVVGTITYNIDGIDYSANLIASHDVEASASFNITVKLVAIIVVLILFAFAIRFLGNGKKHKKRGKLKNNLKVF